jgi:hypothetical protein
VRASPDADRAADWAAVTALLATTMYAVQRARPRATGPHTRLSAPVATPSATDRYCRAVDAGAVWLTVPGGTLAEPPHPARKTTLVMSAPAVVRCIRVTSLQGEWRYVVPARSVSSIG